MGDPEVHRCVCGWSTTDYGILTSHVAIMNGVNGKKHATVVP